MVIAQHFIVFGLSKYIQITIHIHTHVTDVIIVRLYMKRYYNKLWNERNLHEIANTLNIKV